MVPHWNARVCIKCKTYTSFKFYTDTFAMYFIC